MSPSSLVLPDRLTAAVGPLRRAPSAAPCLHGLLGSRPEHLRPVPAEHSCHPFRAALDHVAVYTARGGRVLVSRPYGHAEEIRPVVEAIVAEHGLEGEILEDEEDGRCVVVLARGGLLGSLGGAA